MESFDPDTDELSEVNDASDTADLRRKPAGMFGAGQDDDESSAIPIGQRIVGMGGPSGGGDGVQSGADEDISGPQGRLSGDSGADDGGSPQGDGSDRLAAHSIDPGLGFVEPETTDDDEFGDPLAAYRSNDQAVGGARSNGDGENAEFGDVSGMPDSGEGEEPAPVGGDGEEEPAADEEESSGEGEEAEREAEPEAVPPAPPARGQKHSGVKAEPMPMPTLKGSVGGKGAANNPEDVKAVQRLLNLAVANGEEEYQPLVRFGKIAEDGKVTPRMLEMLQAYQRSGGSASDAVLDPQTKAGQRVLRGLAKNKLADPRWSKYDDVIRREVDYYNKFFSDARKFPGFKPLDWRLVKAMLWQETGGPDYKPAEWKSHPMQIGRGYGSGLEALRKGTDHTSLFLPKELRDKLLKQDPTGQLNIRAGIAYFYSRAMQPEMTTILDDPSLLKEVMKPGENPKSFAARVGTTPSQLMKDNGLDEAKANRLRAGQTLVYHKAHEVPVWRDWMDASNLYNHHDPTYREKVGNNYSKIQRVWSR